MLVLKGKCHLSHVSIFLFLMVLNIFPNILSQGRGEGGVEGKSGWRNGEMDEGATMRVRCFMERGWELERNIRH